MSAILKSSRQPSSDQCVRFARVRFARVRSLASDLLSSDLLASDCSIHAIIQHVVFIEIVDIECVLLSFLSKILCPQNGGFIRAFWLVPDSYAENFARLRGVRLFFCQAKFTER